ncbi:GNAT family N-acetyltransferase [Bacillus solitudinis]|uniref:GNAT family N-acetyltransferase n=1 Tax=Bacillus solitudinis TaxID=2014074 RepID=UPI000C2440B1|nr:GNAT family N-acetyltransferase [Bacillus solitudinis]
MLLPYKTVHKKIAMGLLSFMPKEKELKKLIKTMERYETEANWQLYLWQEGHDFVGIIGIKVEEQEAKLQHLCVNPSFREEGIGKKMIQAINEQHSFQLIPTKETKGFFQTCQEDKIL